MKPSPQLIDLKGRKGATINVQFKNVPSAPFFVIVTDLSGRDVFYYRFYDKETLWLNLPKHPEKVLLYAFGGPQIEMVMVSDLRKPKLPYKLNYSKVVSRPYPISQVKYEKTNGLPFGSPARFLYDRGVIQADTPRMQSMPQPVRMFVLSHELGHYYYVDEVETDRFGLYNYLNQGYNFSGAYNSLADFLSPSKINVERIVSMYNEIKRLHPEIY